MDRKKPIVIITWEQVEETIYHGFDTLTEDLPLYYPCPDPNEGKDRGEDDILTVSSQDQLVLIWDHLVLSAYWERLVHCLKQWIDERIFGLIPSYVPEGIDIDSLHPEWDINPNGYGIEFYNQDAIDLWLLAINDAIAGDGRFAPYETMEDLREIPPESCHWLQQLSGIYGDRSLRFEPDFSDVQLPNLSDALKQLEEEGMLFYCLDDGDDDDM